MKRRISLLLALVIVLGSFGTAFAAVPTTAEGKADFLKEQKILQGNKKGELMLDMKENRQNMVVMLSRLMQKADEAKDYTGKEADKFEDVINKDYRTYIAWSVANNYIVGKSETNFGSHDKVTAQHYSIVLLRALNYFSAENLKLESEEGFAKAKELGLLKDLEKVEAKTEITRAEMSVMIYNALGTTVNGENITLAEKLGIKMPVDETLEVKKVRTENLGEVIVELSNAAAVANQKELLNPDNYNVFGSQDRTVKEIKLDGNNVIVVLENTKNETPLVKGRDYKLIIRNVDPAINGEDYTFTATDNAIPVVEKIVALGEYGIKVVFSEPIKNTSDLETKFVLKDAKYGNVNMKVDYYGGRELTLIPYHRGETFPVGEATLVVKPVEDLSGLKSIETELKAEIKHNSVKPEVEKVEVKNTRVIVTFKEDVYSRSIHEDNITWTESRKGGSVIEATKANILDGRRVEYLFEGDAQIPADLNKDRITITISGVTNFSKVKMAKYEELHTVELDYTRPEVKGFYLESVDEKYADVTEAIVRTRLHFTKDLDADYVKKVNTHKDEDGKLDLLPTHIKLYGTKVNRYDDLIKGDLIKGAIKSVEMPLDENKKPILNELVISFNKDKIVAGENYKLEVEKFRDNTSLGNRMLDFGSRFFREGQTDDFVVTKASHTKVESGDRRGMIKVSLNFSEAVNRDTATNKTNYVFELRNGKEVDMLDMQAHSQNEIVVRNNGRTVDLYVAQGKVKTEELVKLTVKNSVKDVDGNRLKEEFVYEFKDKIVKEIEDAIKALKEEVEEATDKDNKGVKAAVKAAEEILKDYEDGKDTNINDVKAATDAITAAMKAVEAYDEHLKLKVVKQEAINNNVNLIIAKNKYANDEADIKEVEDFIAANKDNFTKDEIEKLQGKVDAAKGQLAENKVVIVAYEESLDAQAVKEKDIENIRVYVKKGLEVERKEGNKLLSTILEEMIKENVDLANADKVTVRKGDVNNDARYGFHVEYAGNKILSATGALIEDKLAAKVTIDTVTIVQ